MVALRRGAGYVALAPALVPSGCQVRPPRTPHSSPALEQLLKLGRWRVREERAHPPGAYRRRRGLPACSVTFTLNQPLRAAYESR